MFRVISLIAAFWIGSCPAVAASCIDPPNEAGVLDEIVTEINRVRRSHGLSAVQVVAPLERSAQHHACDLAKRMTLSHYSADGATPRDRLTLFNGRAGKMAENISRYNYDISGKALVARWLASPDHKLNLLLKDASLLGVGISMTEGTNWRWFVMDIAKAK